MTQPIKACAAIENCLDIEGQIGIVERGECMFVDKVGCQLVVLLLVY